MIKILQIGMTRNIGGLETYLMQQFRHLDRSRVTYDFVNITAEHEIVFADEIRAAGSEIFGVVSRHKSPIKHYLQWLRLLWRTRGRYKAIVLNSTGLSYVFPIFAAMFFGIPIRIMHSHNAGFESNIGAARRLLIAFNKVLMLLSATHFFACSPEAGRWMFGNRAFTVINNAIDCRQFRYSLERRNRKRRELGIENAFVLGHVGRFTYPKNHAFLIEVFAAIARKMPDAMLILIGDAVEDRSFLDEARRKVRDYELDLRVRFLGMRTDVAELFQAMDCFLLPSRFEGLGIVAIEAQAAGLPCIVSSAVPRAAEITRELLKFLPLDAIDAWVEAIENARSVRRRDTTIEIAEAGYDIRREIEKLERFFEE